MKLLFAWLLGVPVSIAGMMNVMSIDVRSALLGTERPALESHCSHVHAVTARELAADGDCRPATVAVADLTVPRHRVAR